MVACGARCVFVVRESSRIRGSLVKERLLAQVESTSRTAFKVLKPAFFVQESTCGIRSREGVAEGAEAEVARNRQVCLAARFLASAWAAKHLFLCEACAVLSTSGDARSSVRQVRYIAARRSPASSSVSKHDRTFITIRSSSRRRRLANVVERHHGSALER